MKQAELLKSEIEEIYDLYPRKMGKTLGIKKAKKMSQTELQKLKQAVLNYCEYVKENKIEEKFIKHFSTFVNQYEDFMEKPTTSKKTINWDYVFGTKDHGL